MVWEVACRRWYIPMLVLPSRNRSARIAGKTSARRSSSASAGRVRRKIPEPRIFGPLNNRASVQERIELWGRRAGAEWARAHAKRHHQRVLDDNDIVFEYIVIDLSRHGPKKVEIYLDLDLIE